MARSVTFKISGRGAEDDAPSAEDFLRQFSDLVDILEGVEQAVAGGTKGDIEWRITSASRNSPLEIVVTPYSKEFGVSIDDRVGVVTTAIASGLQAIDSGATQPPYFSEPVLGKLERMARRTLDGLAATNIDFGPDLPALQMSRASALRISQNLKSILSPNEKPYEEIGSIEGFFSGVERDGYGRPVLYLKHRLSGDKIKCLVSESAISEVGEERIATVYDRRRILVTGRIKYKSLGNIREVVADHVQVIQKKEGLPSIEDIQDPNLTGGMLSEEYLERLRDGRLS